MICFPLFMQWTACARHLERDKTGNNIAARIAIMAITTSNSMSVNAVVRGGVPGGDETWCMCKVFAMERIKARVVAISSRNWRRRELDEVL